MRCRPEKWTCSSFSGQRCGNALQDGVARQRMRLRVAEVDGKENRYVHRFSVQLGGNETQLLRTLYRGGIERGIAARLLDACGVRGHLAIAIHVQPQRYVPLHLTGVERGRVPERGAGLEPQGQLMWRRVA